MKLVGLIFLMNLVLSLPSVAGAATVSKSKAIELAVHRIERLVTLKKIDTSFRTALISLGIVSISEGDAAFKVEGFVSPDSTGKSAKIEIWMDDQGKTLSYTVDPSGTPVDPVRWPKKDSATLFEEALHFVLEGWVKNPQIKTYFENCEKISLEPMQDSRGNLMAKFKVQALNDPKILNIEMLTDGGLVSFYVD